MKNKASFILIICFISMIVLWLLCPFLADNFSAEDGHLPSDEPNNTVPTAVISPSVTPRQEESPGPVDYYTKKESGPGFDLSMHILEIDPLSPEIELMPVTSHKTLFGYEYLSEMNEKWDAVASINGGFSHSNGLLGGLYSYNGELFTPATGQYPVLFMSGGKAFISEAVCDIWLESDNVKLDKFYYNQYPEGDGLYLFTPAYGTRNRIGVNHLNAVISNGEVQGLIERNSSFEIPQDGLLVSAIGKYAENRLRNALKTGMAVSLKYDILADTGIIDDYSWAYECGSWIIRDSRIIVPKKDTWVGTLQSRTPRTAVGIKEDGTVIFVVSDGRQEGLSDGLTGEELAERLMELDVKDAVFLDGGASSEMIVNGSIVNSPSAGRERMLAVSFVIVKK